MGTDKKGRQDFSRKEALPKPKKNKDKETEKQGKSYFFIDIVKTIVKIDKLMYTFTQGETYVFKRNNSIWIQIFRR